VDPVATGLVRNLSKPDGNVTGASTFDPEQARQQVELLKEAIPGLARVVILGDSGAAPASFQAIDDAARAAGLETVVLKVERGSPDFEAAFATAKKEGAQAAIVLSTPVTTPHRRRIAEASIRVKIATLSPRDHADAGGLLSFGTSFSEATRRAAAYVAKILEGAKPGELPIEMVRRRELVINKRTANEIGVKLPAILVSRAHQVIE
jgi:putative ABC transport system substrate-binding protein